VRDHETAIELSYIAQITPWWSLQPDLQYVIHPGGNVADPKAPRGVSSTSDALVLGLRTTFKF